MKILVIYTGGTIGMVRTAAGFAPSAGLVEAELQKLGAELEHGFALSLATLVPAIDSANASPLDWNRIADEIVAAYQTHDAFVVIHGTDTLAFTASALCFALEGLGKPVILTGAMVPLSEPGSDGSANLADALRAAQSSAPGVWVQFAGKLLHGARARKVHSSAFDAFTAGDAAVPPCRPAGRLQFHRYADASVSVLTVAPGGCTSVFEYAMGHCDGVILRCYGAGTAPDTPGLRAGLAAAKQRGIPVVAVSQSDGGGAAMGTYASGSFLVEAGVIDGGAMTVEAAYAKLTHVLGLAGPVDRRALVEVDLCGEFGSPRQVQGR